MRVNIIDFIIFYSGFLSTGDHNSPGNYGILDQIMALTWVYDNINNFNGDRNSITLFGPDAGAASAGILMVNPRTAHMVSKVIAQVSCGHMSLEKRFLRVIIGY